MATQLFLTSAAAGLGSGKLALSTTRGIQSVSAQTTTVTSGTDIPVTATTGGTALTWWFQLGGSGTISGNVSANIRGLETTGANAGAGIQIDLYNSDGATFVQTILSDRTVPSTITVYTTSDSAKALAAVAPTSTSYIASQWICVTLKVRNVGTMATGSVTNSYNGPTAAAAGDTYVTFVDTLVQETPLYPTVASSGTPAQGNGSSASIAPSVPSGVTTGALVVAEVSYYFTQTTTAPADTDITPPAGWTSAGQYQAFVNTPDSVYILSAWFYHYATGADSGTYSSFTAGTVGGQTGRALHGAAFRISNGPTSGNPTLGSLHSSFINTTGTTVTASTFTPTSYNALLLEMMNWDLGSGTATLPLGHQMLSTGANTVDASSSAHGWSAQQVSAATGSLTFTSSVATANMYANVLTLMPGPYGTRVQQYASGSNFGNNAVTVTMTFSAAPTAGNLLLFVLSYYALDTLGPPAGLTSWGSQTTAANSAMIVYTRAVQSGDTASWAFTTTDLLNITAFEIANTTGGSSPFDAAVTFATGTGPPVAANAVTPTVGTDLALTFVADNNTAGVNVTAAGSPWSGYSVIGGNNFHDLWFAYDTNPTSGSALNTNWTATGGGDGWIATTLLISYSANGFVLAAPYFRIP